MLELLQTGAKNLFNRNLRNFHIRIRALHKTNFRPKPNQKLNALKLDCRPM